MKQLLHTMFGSYQVKSSFDIEPATDHVYDMWPGGCLISVAKHSTNFGKRFPSIYNRQFGIKTFWQV